MRSLVISCSRVSTFDLVAILLTLVIFRLLSLAVVMNAQASPMSWGLYGNNASSLTTTTSRHLLLDGYSPNAKNVKITF